MVFDKTTVNYKCRGCHDVIPLFRVTGTKSRSALTNSVSVNNFFSSIRSSRTNKITAAETLKCFCYSVLTCRCCVLSHHSYRRQRQHAHVPKPG